MDRSMVSHARDHPALAGDAARPSSGLPWPEEVRQQQQPQQQPGGGSPSSSSSSKSPRSMSLAQAIEVYLERHRTEVQNRPPGDGPASGVIASVPVSPRALIERIANGEDDEGGQDGAGTSSWPPSARGSQAGMSRSSSVERTAPRPASELSEGAESIDTLRSALRDARIAAACDDDEPLDARRAHRERVRVLEGRLAQLEQAQRLGALASPSSNSFQSWLADVAAHEPDKSSGRAFFAQMLHATQEADAHRLQRKPTRIVAREAIERRKRERESRRRWPGWPRPPWHGSGADAPWELDFTAKLKNSSALVTGMIINCTPPPAERRKARTPRIPRCLRPPPSAHWRWASVARSSLVVRLWCLCPPDR